MKVSLINIDSVIPNLALHKLAIYHQNRGDEVLWDFPLVKADKTYVSCIFDYNRHKCLQFEGHAEIGGSGYSLTVSLPDEVEAVKPKINFGFTTRGCIRKCSFCVVPQKEGAIHIVGDIYDLWDGKARMLTLMDNNILALPDHFKFICGQLRKENLQVDFNQGLDCRLLTEDLAAELKTLKLKELRFAFDNIAIYDSVVDCVKLLKKVGISPARWYVYADENWESALERILILKRLGQFCYLMRDRRVYAIPKFISLSRWATHPPLFYKKDIYDHLIYENKIQETHDEGLFAAPAGKIL